MAHPTSFDLDRTNSRTPPNHQADNPTSDHLYTTQPHCYLPLKYHLEKAPVFLVPFHHLKLMRQNCSRPPLTGSISFNTFVRKAAKLAQTGYVYVLPRLCSALGGTPISFPLGSFLSIHFYWQPPETLKMVSPALGRSPQSRATGHSPDVGYCPERIQARHRGLHCIVSLSFIPY